MSLHNDDIFKFIAEMGMTHVGMGRGRNDLYGAVETAIGSIEYQGVPMNSARRLICRLLVPPDILLSDIDRAMAMLDAQMHADAQILWYTTLSEDLNGEIAVLLAGGFVDV